MSLPWIKKKELRETIDEHRTYVEEQVNEFYTALKVANNVQQFFPCEDAQAQRERDFALDLAERFIEHVRFAMNELLTDTKTILNPQKEEEKG